MKRQRQFSFGFVFFAILTFYFPAQVFAEKELAKEDLFKMSLSELMDIELTVATRSSKLKRRAPAIASVVTARQIEDMGARNLTEVLITIPGFGLQTSQGWSRTEIEVRGISGLRNSAKVMVMVDGHKLNDPYFGGASSITDDFPLKNIKQIEIIRGPGSAMYGANAFVAVINIVTKKVEDIDGMQINLGRGSFDTSSYNVLFGKKIDDLEFSANLNYFDTESQKRFIAEDSLTGSGVSEAPGFTNYYRERYDIQINTDYKNLGFMLRFINKEHGALVGPRDHLGDDNRMKLNGLYSEIHHKYEITEKAELLNKIYYDRLDLDFFFELYPEGTVLGPTTFPKGVLYQGTTTENTFGYNLQLDSELFEDNIFTGGFVWEYISQTNVTTKANFEPRPLAPSDPGFMSIPPDEFWNVSDSANFSKPANRTVLAGYVQDDWQISDEFSLTLGTRYDYYDDVGERVNPRLALVYSPMSDLDIKLLYGSAFRAPNFTEMYNRNNKGVLGNPDLKPEKLSTYEAGLEYRFTRHYLSINCFYSDIKDLITLSAPDINNPDSMARGLRTFENLNNVKSWGGEMEFKIVLENHGYIYANYSYQRSIDDNTKRRLSNVPKHRGNVGINLALGEYINIHPHLFVSGKRLRSEDDSRDPLGGYALVNFAVIAKNFREGLEIRATIHNLMDKAYANPATQSLPGDYPQQGRDFFLEVCYKF